VTNYTTRDPRPVNRDPVRVKRHGVSCFARVVARYIGRSISAARQQNKLESEMDAIAKKRRKNNE